MRRTNNDCEQRPLTLPGENRRLSKAEVAEQGQQILNRLQAQNQKRVDPSQAPRRAVLRLLDDGTVRLVCGHEFNSKPGDTAALSYRCLACLREGRT